MRAARIAAPGWGEGPIARQGAYIHDRSEGPPSGKPRQALSRYPSCRARRTASAGGGRGGLARSARRKPRSSTARTCAAPRSSPRGRRRRCTAPGSLARRRRVRPGSPTPRESSVAGRAKRRSRVRISSCARADASRRVNADPLLIDRALGSTAGGLGLADRALSLPAALGLAALSSCSTPPHDLAGGRLGQRLGEPRSWPAPCRPPCLSLAQRISCASSDPSPRAAGFSTHDWPSPPRRASGSLAGG